MSGSDIRIVAIAFLLMMTYGTFMYLYVDDSNKEYTFDNLNSTQYSTPDSSNFFDIINDIKDLSVNNEEIFFVNTIFFGLLSLLIVFIGLRYLRGTG